MRFLFILLFTASTAVAQSLPSYDEAVSAYRQNIANAFPLSVEWIVTDFETVDAFDYDVAAAELLGRALADNDVPASLRDQLKAKLQSDQEKTNADSRDIRLKKKSRRHFIWTDGVRIHYRYSDDIDATLDIDFKESLEVAFPHLQLYSYDPARSPKLMVWQGYAADGKTLTGYQADQEIGGLVYRSFLPPLGFVRDEWRRNQNYSCLDTWTEAAVGQSTVLEGPAVGGTKTLQYLTMSPEPLPGIATPDGAVLTLINRSKAICAFERGWIPVETRTFTSGGPQSLEVVDGFPTRDLSYTKADDIVDVDGVFYPTYVSHTRYGTDPKWFRTHSALLADPTAEVPVVPYSIREEKILHIKVRREIPDHWMNFSFPSRTRYMDMDTQELYLTGVPKEDFDRQLAEELTRGTGVIEKRVQLKPPSDGFRWWLIIGNVFAIVALGIIYICTRRW